MRTIWMMLAWAGLLILGLLGMSACGPERSASSDPYATYRPAVKSNFQGDFARVEQAPRYHIRINLAPNAEVMTGTAQVYVTNYSTDTWRHLQFRLYPALPQYGGELALQSVAVDGQPTTFIYEHDNTSVRVDLTDPLPPDEAVRVEMFWRVEIPEWSDDSSVYALFGRSQQMLSLPLFYPSLAVYQPDPVMGRWWSEQGTARGDAAFNSASLFVVTATLPSEQVPVATGTMLESMVLDGVQTQYVWVTGPVREFLLHMSPLFQSAEVEAYDTRVISYWLPGHEAAGRAALNYAVSALRIYSDYYGEYPFREMRVAPGPLNYRGMEYPQVNLLGIELYTRFQNNMEILVAHEVAHQWWYQIVHNDPVNTPWLDEALAEYSVRLYYERLYGPGEAALLSRQRWRTPLDLLLEREQDMPLNRPVESFASGTQYETVVYGKGALLYMQMQDILGERRFRRFLRDYLEQHRYGIVNTNTWHSAIDRLQLPEMEALFQEWVGSPSQPSGGFPAASPTDVSWPEEADVGAP